MYRGAIGGCAAGLVALFGAAAVAAGNASSTPNTNGAARSASDPDAALPVQGTMGNAGRPWPVPPETPAGYHDDATSISSGKALFALMNCAGCHGYTAKGAMGPDLTDDYWRYGGTPQQIYTSIFEGRPQGMPAWGKALTAEDVWKLTAYIASLKADAGSATTNAAPSIDLPTDIGAAAHPAQPQGRQ
jgi:cytochrome c oxidase cbb3-type subunit 3